MTHRDRREARADRLDTWADKREVKGNADLAQARQRADAIPFGQPMLTDHHSYRGDVNYRNKITAGYDRAFTNLNKADEMRGKADGIRAAADRAIYSDDHDALDKLLERIESLEAERDRIKAFNASCKAVIGGDVSLLDDKQRASLDSVRKYSPYSLGKRGQYPGYGLSNLTGNIAKQRKRLLELSRGAT